MRYVALAAIIASLTLCLGLELLSQRKIAERNAIIEQKKREVQPFSALVAEVQGYQVTKDGLQRRIDIINQLKQNQKGPSNAMKILASVDPSVIDSIAIDDKTITINSHAEINSSAEVVERRSAGGRYMLKVKI
jgi:Tfp pilus assembly protein PilN